MKNYNISIIKGDGIGPEIVDEAIKVLNAVSKKCDFTLSYKEYLMGGIAIDTTGVPLPDETVEGVLASDACLFVISSLTKLMLISSPSFISKDSGSSNIGNPILKAFL